MGQQWQFVTSQQYSFLNLVHREAAGKWRWQLTSAQNHEVEEMSVETTCFMYQNVTLFFCMLLATMKEITSTWLIYFLPSLLLETENLSSGNRSWLLCLTSACLTGDLKAPCQYIYWQEKKDPNRAIGEMLFSMESYRCEVTAFEHL